MTTELYVLINHVATVLTAIAMLLCLVGFRQRSPEVRIQFFNFFLSTAVTLYIYTSGISGPPINIPQNIYLGPSVLLTLAMYDVAWKGRHRKITIVSAVLFAAFAAWNMAYGQEMNFNSNTILVGGVFILIHCILFYYYLRLPVSSCELPVMVAGYLFLVTGRCYSIRIF